MYSKKVMEHFQHPKNQGKLKNPDGFGKVGNPICLPPESEIQTNPSFKPIVSLKVGTGVLGENGDYNKVTKIFKRKYSGKIINIKSRLGSTKLTSDHFVKAIKVPKGDKYLRIKNKQSLIPDWHHASELSKNDILLYPIPKKVEDIKKIEVGVPRYKYDFRSKKIPKRIALDKDFLRLAGYFIAEGDTRTKTCHVFLTLVFGSHEKKYIDDVVQLFKRIFNLTATVKTIKKKNTTTVTVNNVHVTRFFRNLFGKGCENKKIPEFMLFLPIKKQKELIKGLWRGDGFVNRKIPRAGFSTISYKLVQQVKFLLIRQGVLPSFYVEKEKTVKGVRHKEAYRIHVGSWSVRKLAKILDEKVCKKEITYDSWSDENYIYFPITAITKELYNGYVHNLEVEKIHSYTTNSALVHNCGDVMWFYIKVKDNKITKTGWETFGCASAIATSSMISELAKGKTIKQAIKITRNDVSNALHGLPPIKQHCSNLAADALHEAIYDYLSKTKQEIPKELKEMHKKAERVLKTIHK